MMRWEGYVAHTGAKRNKYRILVGNSKSERPLRRPRRRWEYNIKMELRETGWVIWTSFIWLRIGTNGGLL
jgi:hypothetical protein